jgi:hypothetical protein
MNDSWVRAGRGWVVLGLLAGMASGCGEDSKAPVAAADVSAGDSAGDSAGGGAVDAAGDSSVTVESPLWPPQDCDPLVPSACALPWPSNLYLQPDKTRKTGYALRFGAKTLPADIDAVHTAAADYAFLDGYSVGTPLMMHWPDVDPAQLPSEASIDKSMADDAPIALLQLDAAGQVVAKVPYWAELDATEKDTAKKTLIVRPAVILQPATRYVVGVRGLKDSKGALLARSAAFEALVAGKTAATPDALRQAAFDSLLGVLDKAGWKKDSLQLAWDFVTNSDEALHARIYKMREDGYKAIGDLGPELKITQTKTFSEADNADVAVEFEGTFRVPNFLKAKGPIYQRLNLGSDGLPQQDGWIERGFIVRVPRSALGGQPHGLVQYGHGLNGTYGETSAGYNGKIANDHKLIFYGCNMTGMSTPDVGSIILFISEMSQFGTMSDKLQTGLLEYVWLQRAMRERFAGLPEVQKLGIQVDKSQMFYSGISQGGIFGGSVIALSKDVTRGHLGVPGNNYSLLLQRSIDFDSFFELIKFRFPASVDQLLTLATIQLQWDQADPVSWYRHIEQDPLPGNSKHQVLIVPAKGDWQVAVLANEIAARSGLGFRIMKNYGKPVYGVTEQDYPYSGSGVVLYDHGNPWPAPGNVPPNDALGDPHGLPRKLPWHQEQMVHFFRTGEIKDVCGGNGCTPD